MSSEMNSSAASMAREELKESALRVESLAAQLSSMQKEVSALVLRLLVLLCPPPVCSLCLPSSLPSSVHLTSCDICFFHLR